MTPLKKQKTIMKTKNMLWAALSMTAALVMTACSNDDNIVETPAAPQAEVKTIPYTVTVNDGAATTRATVDSDNKTLRFATGDKLYITGTNVKGVLEITSGVGETTGATFSGDLTNNGGGTVDPDLSLTATLVSAQQTVGTEVSVSESGAVTVNYPTTTYSDDVATAVQKYSWLTGTSTYSAKSFTLSQETAFLNFEITFVDGTTTGTELSAVVSNNGSAIATANVTTKTVGGKVVAKFVLPVASTTALNGATVTMGDKAARAINNATLTGKVYNVKKTQKAIATANTLAASAVGDVIGANGNAYTVDDTHELPTGVKAEAVVTYKSGSDGFALAIVDYPNKGNHDAASGTYLTQWSSAHPVSGCTWVLPSREQWENTYIGCAGTAPTAIYPTTGYEGKMGNLNTYLTGAGGTAMNDNHWTSTAYDAKEWVCTNTFSATNTCNFNRNDYDRNLLSRYGIAF